MSNYPLGAENDPRAPYNQDDSILEDMIEELTISTLSAFRQMLVDRIMEDIDYEMKYYSPALGWEDIYAESKDDIRETVYDEVYSALTYKLTNE